MNPDNINIITLNSILATLQKRLVKSTLLFSEYNLFTLVTKTFVIDVAKDE